MQTAIGFYQADLDEPLSGHLRRAIRAKVCGPAGR